jgi:hypothetical protein
MSKPIAQTFYINEAQGGVEGVVITKIDVYFQSVSATAGITLQIRTTDNGNPTPYTLPGGTSTLHVVDTYANGTPIIRASADATIPVTFELEQPVVVQSMTPYAFVLTPLGGNPEYTVWTAEINGTDVTNKTPIDKNNDTGTLFLSSNDVQFTSIQTEDIKFTIYRAEFSTSPGIATYVMTEEENIIFSSLAGSFQPNEPIFLSNAAFKHTAMTVNANTGTFTAGESVYQSNGTANVATGVVYVANTSTMYIQNTTGSFTTSDSGYRVIGVTSSASANISAVNNSVVSYSNSIIRVPFTGNSTANIYYANMALYVGTSNRSAMDVVYVTSVVNSTALALNTNNSFSDTSCLFGQVRGDKYNMYGLYSGPQSSDPGPRQDFTTTTAFLLKPNTNITSNFLHSYDQYFIGLFTKSSAVSKGTSNRPYNAVIPNFSDSSTKSTNISYEFQGKYYANNAYSDYIKVYNNKDTELTDATYMLKSRSSEKFMDSSNNSFRIKATFNTNNSKISPYIDPIMNYATMTKNQTVSNTSGFKIYTSNSQGAWRTVNTLYQSNGSANIATGVLLYSQEGSMYVTNTTGTFVSGYNIVATDNTSINAYVSSTVEVGERYNTNVFPMSSRYISKNAVLADGQDAEDLKVYLTAYRPAKTNFEVYGKVINIYDPELPTAKIWSRLQETSPAALLSSGVNKNDFVELVYDLPASNLLLASGLSCNTTSPNVTVSSTAGISNNDFVYLYDTSSNTFIVRQVSYTGNLTSTSNITNIVLTSAPSFTSTNADLGIIPGLEHADAAFKFSNNYGIARYVSSGDVVYDSFKNFAIKIVPTADSPALIPRAEDMRALALQV